MGLPAPSAVGPGAPTVPMLTYHRRSSRTRDPEPLSGQHIGGALGQTALTTFELGSAQIRRAIR